MKLTNDQILTLGTNGFAKLNYSFLPSDDAIKAYRLRKLIVKACDDIAETIREVGDDAWTDKDLRARCAEYAKNKTGMTEKEYKAALADADARAKDILTAYGRESRDIDIHPIAFDSWCLLLRNNPFLAGYEELLADFIAE